MGIDTSGARHIMITLESTNSNFYNDFWMSLEKRVLKGKMKMNFINEMNKTQDLNTRVLTENGAVGYKTTGKYLRELQKLG